ncbi:unnamed protein product [Arctia plantaginis]|uniref:Peptidase M14 domain-containing protein n=1 Tax=Arctia plantaginis TaxID=874455 RepID=A0A8S0ZM62_ARCPL|nr:unnamed protein product [Arctia plantaginis]
MPQSSSRRPSSSETYRSLRSKQNLKVISSQEIRDFEQYYEIESTPGQAFRDEHYVVDEFIFKTKNKNSSSYSSRSKPIMCALNDYLTRNVQSSKSIGPIKNVELGFKDKELKNDTDPTKVPMDWDNYHRLGVIHKFMDDLEFEFPSLCTTGVIGKSLENRDLKILKISNSDASNSRVWIDAGIHAREWIAPAVSTFVANHIARNFDSLPESVRNKDWYFMPVLNPDGYEYTHTSNRMWRKNKAYIRHKLFGVDLNRNFSLGWGGKGSSDVPTNSFYRGPRPFSEPESAAMRDIFLHSGVTFEVYITLHSFGQVIIMPFAYKDDLAPDYIKLLEGATVMSKAIYDTNGNTYKVGISKDVMYQASGTSNDWSHGEVGIPFCYLIELRSKKHKFKVPKEEIAETGLEILNCVIALMEFVDNYKTPNIGNCQDPASKSEKSEESISKENESKKKDETDIPEANITGTDLKPSKTKVTPVTVHPQAEVQFSYHSEVPVVHQAEVQVSNYSIASKQSSHQVEVQFTRNGQREFLKSLNTVGAINIWKEEQSTMDVMVEGTWAPQVAHMLREKHVPYKIAMQDVNSLYEQEIVTNNCIGPPRNATKACMRTVPKMNWEKYHRLDTIYAFMDELALDYPELCTICCIGTTEEGRGIKMLKISNGNENNQGVWLDGATHAREWITVAVVTYIADQLAKNFKGYPDYITDKDWYILPVSNPDGYEYSHTTDRMWRKNRARYGDCIGVDLNRNWSCGWGEKGEEGSSEDPGSIFYRGPNPFSECETIAIKNVILQSGTDFKVFLSFHSYGESIIFPWGYTSDPCPDYVMLLEGGTTIAKGIYEISRHTYKVGSTKDVMYYAAGTSIDWSYGVANIPFSYMLELRGKEHRFLLPSECILTTATEVLNGVLNLLCFVCSNACMNHDSCSCPT